MRRARSLLAWTSAALGVMSVPLSAIAAGPAPAPAVSATGWAEAKNEAALDQELNVALRKAGFTGRIASTLEKRLGRPVNPELAKVGQALFFDPVIGLHNDNSCAGCHAPNAAFGDTQSIAIGIQSNMVVGKGREGPRNQRRAPTVLNVAFLPALMLNGRMSVASGDPFNNSQGFVFPAPEGTTRFPANDPVIRHLLQAHAHMPITELNESAGFTGTRGTIAPEFDQFDDGKGLSLPLPDGSGSRNEPLRGEVVKRLNATKGYVDLFSAVFPEVRGGSPITAVMFAQAIAEFEFSLTRADAPIDQYARGKRDAMSLSEKRGALLFFGKANCVACHAVAGNSNEMFSDFKNRVIGVPPLAPNFGIGMGNTIFDGPGRDEDFGLEQVTGDPNDRYRFRTSPLRNVGLQKTFFHNGAFTELDDAIKHHLDVFSSARNYDPKAAGVDKDLRQRKPPVEPILQRVDPLLSTPMRLSESELRSLTHFVKNALTDTKAKDENFCKLIPKSLPSGYKPMTFQGCPKSHD